MRLNSFSKDCEKERMMKRGGEERTVREEGYEGC